LFIIEASSSVMNNILFLMRLWFGRLAYVSVILYKT